MYGWCGSGRAEGEEEHSTVATGVGRMPKAGTSALLESAQASKTLRLDMYRGLGS